MTDAASTRRGRPPSTTRRDIEVVALKLFSERGFDETSVDEIAAAAGINRRSLFRYFDSKAAILWHDFDHEVERIEAAFREVPPEVPLMTAIRQVVVASNRYRAACS